MKGILNIGLLIGILVACVVGVGVVLPTLSDIITKQTTIYTVTDENLGTISSVPTVVQTANYPVVAGSETLTLDNTTSSVTLTKDTDYTVVSYEEGKFNITTLGGLTGTITVYADYQWYYPEYIQSSVARLLVKYLPVITAVLLFMAVVALLNI